MIECANSESTGEMRQFSVRRHLSSASGKGGQWVVHPVDSNAFLYRGQATIKYNVLLSCLRLLFIMGRKGGFSCPGGEQKLLMELFYVNPVCIFSSFLTHPDMLPADTPLQHIPDGFVYDDTHF